MLVFGRSGRPHAERGVHWLCQLCCARCCTTGGTPGCVDHPPLRRSRSDWRPVERRRWTDLADHGLREVVGRVLEGTLIRLGATFPTTRLGGLRVVWWAVGRPPHACLGGAATPHIGEVPGCTAACSPAALAGDLTEEEAEAVARALCPTGLLARGGVHAADVLLQGKADRGRPGAGRLGCSLLSRTTVGRRWAGRRRRWPGTPAGMPLLRWGQGRRLER